MITVIMPNFAPSYLIKTRKQTKLASALFRYLKELIALVFPPEKNDKKLPGVNMNIYVENAKNEDDNLPLQKMPIIEPKSRNVFDPTDKKGKQVMFSM